MADVGGVSARDKQWDALRDAESGPKPLATADVLKQVQKDTGFQHQTTVRGDDKTLDEVVDDQKGLRENFAGIVALATKVAEGYEIAGLHIGGHAAAGGAIVTGSAGGVALAIGAPILAYGAMVYEVAEAGEKGRAQAEALYRDQTHVAMLFALKLPQEFRAGELKKYPTATNEAAAGTVSRLTTTMNGKDKGLLPLLQLHCDQGMSAAKDASDSKLAPGDYLKSHPTAAQRYASDPAFKAGFDSMVWARSQGDASYAAACADLKTRVVDYDSHSVPVRL